jgi:hypothetical protein
MDATSRLNVFVNDGAYRRMYPTKTLFPPAAFSASIIRCAEGIESVIGFSMKTSFPAWREEIQRGSWNSSAASMKTRSTSEWEMVSEGLVVW